MGFSAITRSNGTPQLDAIAAPCKRHHVARLHAFGSVLRTDYRPGESDIDLLVEFQPLDASSLYKAYFTLLNELRQSLASRVDLVMADAVRNTTIQRSIDAIQEATGSMDSHWVLPRLGHGSAGSRLAHVGSSAAPRLSPPETAGRPAHRHPRRRRGPGWFRWRSSPRPAGSAWR